MRHRSMSDERFIFVAVGTFLAWLILLFLVL